MRNADTDRALQALTDGDFTCVMCKGETLIESKQRGVAPLLSLLTDKLEEGFCAADKVVGKAAAFLYALLRVKEVYALVISEPAVQTLKRFGIAVEYEALVPAIRNRTNTGFCPMESAVLAIEDPQEALVAIRQTLERLKG